MTLEELQREVVEFARERDWEQFHAPKNLAMSVSVEAAELLEVFMWISPEESRQLDAKKLAQAKDEMGDVLICLTNLAAQLGVDLLSAAHEKIQKNRDKYPVSKAKGSAKKYDDF